MSEKEYWINIVEICEVGHRRASELIERNEALGWTIFKYKGHYVSLYANNNVWRSPTAEFAPRNGLYIFKD